LLFTLLQLVLHSNGPNRNFGRESVTCSLDADDPFEPDELNLIVSGKYYGHPNRLRGGNGDPRQCTFRGPQDVNETYTQPIAKLPSSSNGICEFQTEHFGGQLRGQLIVGQWQSALRNIKLSADGLTTVSGISAFPPKLVDKGGLDVTQGPGAS
jgi:glucose/arabinose dehydrogenase